MTEVLAQRIVFPSDESPEELYFRYFDKTGSGDRPHVLSRRSIRLPAASELSTSSYFNSVFAEYWSQHTDAARWKLRVVVSGAGVVKLVASSLVQRLVLERIEFSGERTEIEATVDAQRFSGGDLSLLFFDVLCLDEAVVIHEAGWHVDVEEAKPVRLIAGYCTFNRDNYLLHNINTLLGDRDVIEGLEAIVIADNGRSSRLLQTLPSLSDKIVLRQQDNVGGAGGFARVMLEALADGNATHVLLMDDDAYLETESVFRVMAFYACATSEFAIGGQMLDLVEPEVLTEAGATFLLNRMTSVPHWSGVDLKDVTILQQMSRPAPVDYNAWWFFACPLTAIRRVGLPLPLFIRGDDVELGFRLLEDGTATVPLPGLAVWHEPFDAKIGGWHAYFVARNKLVIVACHGTGWAKSARKAIRRQIVKALLSLDYYEAWLLIRGVEDFLAGPDCLEQPTLSKINEFVAKRNEFQSVNLSRAYQFPRLAMRSPRFLRHFSGIQARFQLMRHRYLPAAKYKDMNSIKGFIDGADRHYRNLMTRDYFVVKYALSDDYSFRQRDPSIARQLCRQMDHALRHLRRREASLTEAWQAAAARFRTVAWWREHLGMDTASVAGVEDGAAETSADSGKSDDLRYNVPNAVRPAAAGE